MANAAYSYTSGSGNWHVSFHQGVANDEGASHAESLKERRRNRLCPVTPEALLCSIGRAHPIVERLKEPPSREHLQHVGSDGIYAFGAVFHNSR
jgi:hypothetical protein